MVSKCANPECTTPFRHMRAGRLIRVESRGVMTGSGGKRDELASSRRTEFLWLCGECSSKGMAFEKDGTLTHPELCAKAAAGL
jgi:hypothetical protein